MGEYVRIVGTGEVTPGSVLAVEINGRSIAIFNIDGAFFALNTYDSVAGKQGRT